MTDKIQIENDVPIPVRSDVPPLPLDEMVVGDSIVVPITKSQEKGTIRQRIHRYQLTHPPAKFSMITKDEHSVRVFRIEDSE